MKKKNNILIVGCGKMGSAHIKSFLNKDNINLYLYDKSKIKLNSFKKIKNIHLLSSLKLKANFHFCIISTNSKQRFSVFKKLMLQKKIEIFLLEKFMFLVKKHHINVKNYFDVKKIYNNVWGKYLYKEASIFNLKSYHRVRIFIEEGHLLTNLIHFMNFFSYYQKYLKIFNSNLKLIKFKKQDELKGNLILQYSKQKVIYQTKKINNIFEMHFNTNNQKKSLKIILKKNLNLFFYENSKLLKIAKFPLASFFSYKIFKKNSLVPSFNEILDDNLNIIDLIKTLSKKKIIIR